MLLCQNMSLLLSHNLSITDMWFSRAGAISSSYPFFELRAYRIVNQKKRQINAILEMRRRSFITHTCPGSLVIHVLMIIFSHGHNNSPAERQWLHRTRRNESIRRRGIDRVIINKSNNAELSNSAGWESVPTCRIYINTHNDWRSSDNNNNNNVQQTERERENITSCFANNRNRCCCQHNNQSNGFAEATRILFPPPPPPMRLCLHLSIHPQ